MEGAGDVLQHLVGAGLRVVAGEQYAPQGRHALRRQASLQSGAVPTGSPRPAGRVLAMALTLAAGTAACGLKTPLPPPVDAGPGGVAGGGLSAGGRVDGLGLPEPVVACSVLEGATGLRLMVPKQFGPPLCAQEARADLFDSSIKTDTFTIVFLPAGRSEDARRLMEDEAVVRQGDELEVELFKGVRDSRLVNPQRATRRGPNSGQFTTSLDGVPALVSWVDLPDRRTTSVLWEPPTRGQWSIHLTTGRSRKVALELAEDLFG